MSRLMSIRKTDSPAHIAALVCRECLFEDCEGVEHHAFVLGLQVGSEARRFNPFTEGTDRYAAFETGVAISQAPPPPATPDALPTRDGHSDLQLAFPLFMSSRGIQRELSSIQSDIAISREEDVQLMLGASAATLTALSALLVALPL